MIKRIFIGLLVMLMLTACAALAEGDAFVNVPGEMRPGKSERISFRLEKEDTVTLSVTDEMGQTIYVIRENFKAPAGENHMIWDGLKNDGEAPLPGNYQLQLTGENTSFSVPLLIGREAPKIVSVSAPGLVNPGDIWSVTVEANMPGTLSLYIQNGDGEWNLFLEESVPEGESVHYWNGMVNGQGIAFGDYAVQLKLMDENGYTGTPQQISLSVEPIPTATPMPTATPAPTPRIVIPSAVEGAKNEPRNYWNLQVGVMDEAAIWDVMMQPMTVIDGEQKEVYRLRKTPDKSTKKENVVGEITYASQGVHVLETLDNGWTLVEAFNSSYGPDCKSRRGYGVTDDLIQGYVETRLLKTYTPKDEYGLLIDKLEQKMYIFSDGKCIGELMVSTGLNNETQSWNETPSGEFVMISRMGGFPAGNLWCAYGMRINGGCAIHEVPYIGDHETPSDRRDYSSTVPQLGKKASHGCIRVQKEKNEQGQNIKWLWDNIKVGTKVLIWDDTGRLLSYPDDDMPLYYNPNGGKYYHEAQYCSSVKDRYLPLTEFKYSELDNEFDNLKPCNRCAQVMKKSEIDKINRENGY